MAENFNGLIKAYVLLAKKYKQVKMPSFDELNRDFEIEKIENQDTDFVLRTIRKKMMEKIVNSTGFLEMLMNPVNSPRMYQNCVRSLNSEDMKLVEKIYSLFSKIILEALQLEVEYSEKREAEMIRHIYNNWNMMKSSFNAVLQRLKCLEISDIKKEKSYFG